MPVYFVTAQVGFFGIFPAVPFQEFAIPVYFFTVRVGFISAIWDLCFLFFSGCRGGPYCFATRSPQLVMPCGQGRAHPLLIILFSDTFWCV